ncbi:MAG: ABC transporter permease [Parvularculaceae bacterium]|nr:ABC transporter permease [Parvularculaceae bacterium]
MKAALIIAWREYKQYIFSRGFLLFLVAFPAIVLFVTVGVGFAEKSRPERVFVVFDEAGGYAEAIDAEIAWRRARALVMTFDAYVQAAAEADALESDKIPEPFRPAPLSRARVEAFGAAGVDAAVAAVRPFLKSGAPAFAPPRQTLRRIDLPVDVAAAKDAKAAADLLRPYLLDEKRPAGVDAPLSAAVIIPKGFGAGVDDPAAEFWSRNLTDATLEPAVKRALDTLLQRRAAAAQGLREGALDDIRALEAPFEVFRPDRDANSAQLGLKDRVEQALPAIMTYMLLVIVFSVGNLLLTNTIEERSNKIVEVLLSSVTANELMIGKLVGIGAVGLTMPAIFLIVGAAVALVGGGQSAEVAGAVIATLLDHGLLWVYLFYFLSAYVIFAMIFLAIGAMSNSLQDAQTFMGPVMMVVFLPLPFMLLVYENPNGWLATVLTFIPIYTPYAVMLRAAADPPIWEILLATVLMVAFAALLARYMGRIFRNAILQSAPPKAKDVWELARREAA